MILISNWKDCWKWISTQCFAAIAAGQSTYALYVMTLDKTEQIAFITTYGHYIALATIALAFFGAFGRNINQTSLENKP